MVSRLDDPIGAPIAGAKLPMNRIRLPLRFQITTQNLLVPQSTTLDQDLLVQAIVCPEETMTGLSGAQLLEACRQKYVATAPEATSSLQLMRSQGVAKLLRLPELQTVRAAVPLPLE